MRRSHNEIQLTLIKAARGCGLAFGLADDIGRAGIWLIRHGFDGVGAALTALEHVADTTRPSDTTPTITAATMHLTAAPVAVYGVSVFDCLAAAVIKNADWQRVDSPLLLLGFAGVAAAEYGLSTRLLAGNGAAAFVSAERLACVKTLPVSPSHLTITPTTETPPAADSFITESLVICSAQWEKLSTQAAKTYVASDTQTRVSGAGAGLTDND